LGGFAGSIPGPYADGLVPFLSAREMAMTKRISRAIGLLVALGIVLAVTVAVAQPPQGGRQRGQFFRGFGGSDNLGRLLRYEQVQKELELLDDQKKKLEDLGNEIRTEMREFWSGAGELSQEERQAKWAEFREAMEERAKDAQQRIEKILLPHQMKRLKQIAVQTTLQSRAVSSLTDSTLAGSLGINEAQKEKLQALREETEKKLREVPQQIIEDARKKAMEVLTPAQRIKLEELRGEPFELDRTGQRPGGRGGQPR